MLLTPLASLTIGSIYQLITQPNAVAVQGLPKSINIGAVYWGLGVLVVGQIIAFIIGKGGKDK